MKKRWLIIASLSAVVIFAVLDYLFPAGHGGHEFWWTHVLAFFLFFGFIGCIVLVVIPKFLGHHWLDRKEDYYD